MAKVSPSRNCINFSAIILDEIALEGLDGITLQGLWVRLNACPNFLISIDSQSKQFIWEVVKRLENVSMFELPTERDPLVLFNRFDHIDPELGNVIEPDEPPIDIYPHKMIDDTENGIMGSCKTYHERNDISSTVRQLSLEDADRFWGARLVLVASQSVRRSALMGSDIDPWLDLSAMHFCILERIGRARYHGEVTQGKNSLQCTGEDPKSLFYYRKTLHGHKLITKQVFHLKSNQQNYSGSLLHLPRFFTERKSHTFYLTEKIVEFLRKQPNYYADYEAIRNAVGFPNALKKLFKTSDFQRVVETDVKIPFRTLYPDSNPLLWKHKSTDKEKIVRVAKLINPNVVVRNEWGKDDDVEEEEDEEDPGYLDESRRLIDQSITSQAFTCVDSAGPNGLTQVELGKMLGQNKLQARALCKALLKKGLISTFMNDVGRQRVCRYCSKRYDNSGHLSQQFRKERDKMLSLVNNKSKGSKRKATVDANEESSKTMRLDTTSEAAQYTNNCESQPECSLDFRNQESSFELPVAIKQEMFDLHDTEILLEDSVDYAESSDSEVESSTTTSSSTPSRRDKAASRGLPRKKKKAIKEQMQWTDTRVDESLGIRTEVFISEDPTIINTARISPGLMTGLRETLNNKKLDFPGITTRILKRANLIIEAVQQNKVINDTTKLLKLIHEEEEKEGLSTKIDKKSLLRLLEKLSKDGHVKNIRILIKEGNKEKLLTFVCEPNIAPDNAVIQSTIEQAKMKLLIPSKDKLNQIIKTNSQLLSIENQPTEDPLSQFNSASIHRSVQEMRDLQTCKDSQSFKRNAKYGKSNGFQPKFVRMKTMHQFLFYLIYNYSGDTKLNQANAIKSLSSDVAISEDLVKEMTQLYYPAIDWRMFIPPLPKHSGWPEGWVIMCDILLRLPLSIFLRLVNINYYVQGLDDYTSHPIRKHFLVKSLPPPIRNQLTYGRRYIYNSHDVVSRLCYAGLAQMGPQRLKEKDQIFVYLNRNTSLLDTTTSSPGYHQVDAEKEYTVFHYQFINDQDVDHYWYQLWNICVHTPLGGRMCMSGQDIVVEVLENKPEMIGAVHPRSPGEAKELDTGNVPGDRRGAAGLDSALFAHLKRNWHWTSQNVNHTEMNSLHSTVNSTPNLGKATTPAPPTKKSLREVRKIKGSMPSTPANGVTTMKPASATNSPIMKRLTVIKPKSSKKDQLRKIPMPRASRKKPYYDKADMEALNLMSKLRVDWTSQEDNFLLLCKVASSFLSNNSRQHNFGFQVWRDILHDNIPTSHNKTSRAVQRRILYMMKNASTARSVSLCLEEIKQDQNIQDEFGNMRARLKEESKDTEDLEKKLAEKFTALVKILQGRFQNMRSHSIPQQKTFLPQCPREFRQKFHISSPAQTMRAKGRFQPVKSITDIHVSAINAMIYSSLCCQGDKTSYAYQLFKVYQQYPDPLLRSTMSKIRSDQMVSLRKSYARTKMRHGNFLPVSNCPYQISISYHHLLQTRYQYEIYHESYVMLQKLTYDMLFNTEEEGLELVAVNGGITAAFVEFLIHDKISFEITTPDQLIILDPRIKEQDETYARIVARYKDILRSCKDRREKSKTAALLKKSDSSQLNKDEIGDADANDNDSETASNPKKRKRRKDSTADGNTNSKESLESPPVGFDDDDDYDEDIVESVDDSTDDNTVHFQRNEQNAVARAASRIALYMMREENEDELVTAKVQETQHAHDFFVVNSCKVVCRLKEDIVKGAIKETMTGVDSEGSRVPCSISTTVVPVTGDRVAKVLDKIKKRAIFEGPDGTEDDILNELERDGANVPILMRILNFVLLKKEFGATMKDLLEHVVMSDVSLIKGLSLLEEVQLLLRTGVTEVVLVHHTKVRPWLIHSRKLNRLDKEKLPPVPSKALEFEDVEDEAVRDSCMDAEDVDNFPPVEEDLDASEQLYDGEDTENISSNENRTVLNLQHSKSKRGSSRLNQSSSELLDQLDDVPCDELRIIMRPWIRVDGSLNRRVLDRLLGSVLGHCMSQPGCSLTSIGERFSPALQPVHCRELCEILLELGCLQFKALQRSHQVTLFSKPGTITVANAVGTENESNIFLEPQEDAILRLGIFIGDKAYSKDFLS